MWYDVILKYMYSMWDDEINLKVFVVRIFAVYFLSNFETYTTLLLTSLHLVQ